MAVSQATTNGYSSAVISSICHFKIISIVKSVLKYDTTMQWYKTYNLSKPITVVNALYVFRKIMIVSNDYSFGKM